MRYPGFLSSGGKIGFIAPSFGCATEPYKSAFDNALSVFHKMGYETDLGPNCYEEKGIGISNEPEMCGEELNNAFINSDCDVIISCGGGELMCTILPFVDFGGIRNSKPKWYMGFSDNTNYVFLSAVLMDTAAIYGPCASSFGMEPWHKAIGDAFDIITGKASKVSGYDGWERDRGKNEETPLAPYNITEKTEYVFYPEGMKKGVSFEGRLIGGCLDCLSNLRGTVYDKVSDFNERYKEDGIIWFLEACDLNVMDINRTIWALDSAGWFKYVKGFLIGRPVCIGQEMMGLDHINAVTKILAKYNVPIIMDLDIGHMSPMMPLIVGSYAHVKASGDDFEIGFELK